MAQQDQAGSSAPKEARNRNRSRAEPMQWLMFALGALLLGVTIALAVSSGPTTRQTTFSTPSEPPDKPTSPARTITTANKPVADGVLLALLGAGIVSVAAGAFFNRVTKLTFAGGTGIELSPEQLAAIAGEVPARTNDAVAAQEAYLAVLDRSKEVDLRDRATLQRTLTEALNEPRSRNKSASTRTKTGGKP